jgi:hypothetical protein
MNADLTPIPQSTHEFKLTGKGAAAAFAEWERRYREEPTRFATEMEKAALGLTDYGDQCAAYFFQLILELGQ